MQYSICYECPNHGSDNFKATASKRNSDVKSIKTKSGAGLIYGYSDGTCKYFIHVGDNNKDHIAGVTAAGTWTDQKGDADHPIDYTTVGTNTDLTNFHMSYSSNIGVYFKREDVARYA